MATTGEGPCRPNAGEMPAECLRNAGRTRHHGRPTHGARKGRGGARAAVREGAPAALALRCAALRCALRCAALRCSALRCALRCASRWGCVRSRGGSRLTPRPVAHQSAALKAAARSGHLVGVRGARQSSASKERMARSVVIVPQ
eukprot:gene15919-biopygen7564